MANRLKITKIRLAQTTGTKHYTVEVDVKNVSNEQVLDFRVEIMDATPHPPQVVPIGGGFSFKPTVSPPKSLNAGADMSALQLELNIDPGQTAEPFAKPPPWLSWGVRVKIRIRAPRWVVIVRIVSVLGRKIPGFMPVVMSLLTVTESKETCLIGVEDGGKVSPPCTF